MKRIILEMGSGNNLHGGDYTKAALRAVDDALRHSSIALFSTLGYDSDDMTVNVSIGVQNPSAVDVARVTAHLPRGKANVTVVQGGLDVESADGSESHVIATAAIEAFIDIQDGDWKLSG